MIFWEKRKWIKNKTKKFNVSYLIGQHIDHRSSLMKYLSFNFDDDAAA